MGFSFTATAQCDLCGQLLSSSDEECDHEGRNVDAHVFRRLGEGRESLVGVRAVPTWKWHKLAEDVGEDWIAYEYLGRKRNVNMMLEKGFWLSVEDIPNISMSYQAPDGVSEHISDE
jgi:hypothetical protein